MGTKLRAFFASLLAKAKNALDSFKNKATSDISDLWAKDKGFIILFGVIILGVKFRQLAIDFLVSSSKALFNKTQQQSDVLQKQENAANDQANQLVSDANKLAGAPQDSTDDWNIK